MACVYLHVNRQNGKIYVGQTTKKPTARWENGSGYKGCPYFYTAIQKYGWDNFDHIIYKDGLSIEEAKALEIQLIREFNTTNPALGYNLSTGGDGTPGHTVSAEVREAIRQRQLNMPDEVKDKIRKALTGKKLTAECKKKLSEIFKGRVSPMKGHTHTQGARMKMAEMRKGKSFHSEYQRERIRISNSSRVWSEESRKKMSESAKSREHKPVTAATREKMKVSMNLRKQAYMRAKESNTFTGTWNEFQRCYKQYAS